MPEKNMHVYLQKPVRRYGRERETEREKYIDNQDWRSVTTTPCRVTPPLGARAAAYEGEYYTSTLREHVLTGVMQPSHSLSSLPITNHRYQHWTNECAGTTALNESKEILSPLFCFIFPSLSLSH